MDGKVFYDQYSSLSNVELLKIVRQSDDYQEGAIEAARELLKDRSVSDDEHAWVEEYFKNIELNEKRKEDKIRVYKEKATDFLEPVLKPGMEVKTAKWLNLLLLVIGLQFLWTLYKTTRYLIAFWQCNTCRFDLSILFEIVSLAYVLVIFLLLYKKMRWGWILLFAGNLFSAISQLSQSYLYFKYWDSDFNNVLSFFLPIIINVAFLLFLWRNDIADFFGVTVMVKKKTSLITIGITFFVIAAIAVVYG